MKRKSGLPRIALPLLLVMTFAGCGAALTVAAIGGVVAVGGGGKSGPTANGAATVPAIQVVGDTSGGSVTLQLTLTDAESDVVRVEVRYSTNANEPATALFNKIATGVFTTAAGGTVGPQLPSSPAGITYTFTWNTAKDLGTVESDQIRLQVVVDDKVGNVTPTFVVDNSAAPIVVSATLAAPAGATSFADEQGGLGFVPVTVVIADADASKVTVSALLSLDGGQTFPTVAAGDLVNGAGTVVPSNAVPTTPGGVTYTFRFRSAANAIGSSGTASVVLRFQATATKTSKPLDTASFRVNNASFSAVLNTPQGSAIRDSVDVTYLLIDGAGEALDVQFDFSLQPGAPAGSFATMTVTQIPPHSGTVGLASSSSGTTHHFLWNAFYDTFVLRQLISTSTVTVRATVRRPSTQVVRGPFPTNAFTVDHRLVETIYGKTQGVADNIQGTTSPLAIPIKVATALNKVYFADQVTRRVRVVDLATGLIQTALGGGSDRSNGTAATDYFLQDPGGVTAAANGTLFVGENFVNPANGAQSYTLLRVDGSTPTVTTLRFAQGQIQDVCYDPFSDAIAFSQKSPSMVSIITANGLQTFPAIGGSGNNAVDDFLPIGRFGAAISPYGVAMNFTALPNVVLCTDRDSGQLLAANMSTTTAATVFGITIPPGNVRTVKHDLRSDGSGDPLLSKCVGIAIDAQANVYCACESQVVLKLRASDGASTRIAGTPDRFGFSGDNGPAAQALLSFPGHVAILGNNDIVISDNFNSRVRRVMPNGTIATVAGAPRQNGDGGVAAPAFIKIPISAAQGPAGLIVTDPLSSSVRQIDTTTTAIATFAGDGRSGVGGDGGLAANAGVGIPVGAVANGAGDVYLSQYSDHVIRRVRNGVIATIAGQVATSGATPDGTPLATTLLDSPQGLASNGSCIAVGQLTSQVVLLNDGPAAVSSWGLAGLPGFTSARIAGQGSVAAVTTPFNGALARNVTLLEPIGVCMARNGDLYVADNRWGAVFKVAAATGQISIVAGAPGAVGFNGDAGVATVTSLNGPSCVALDVQERVLYVGDGRNKRYRMVNLDAVNPVTIHGITIPGGQIRTLVGQTQNGGDGLIPPANGGFANGGSRNAPVNVVDGLGSNPSCDASGRFYFSDSDTAKLRYVDAIGTSYTLAGNDALDGVTAPAASLRSPSAIAVLPDGTGYYVVDMGRIRKVSAATNTVTSFIGNGQMTSSGDGGPIADCSFAYYSTQNLGNDINDLGPNGPCGPQQIALSTTAFVTSLIAVADTTAHCVRLANVGNAAFVHTALGLTIPAGRIALLAGAKTVTPEGIAVPVSGSTGDGALAGATTKFLWPCGVAFTTSGLLLVSDTGNDRIRAINLTSGTVAFGTAGAIAPGNVATVFNAGLREPRNLAWEPTSNTVIVQQGRVGGGTPTQIDCLNPHLIPVSAFGYPIAAGGLQRIDSRQTAATNLAGGFQQYVDNLEVARGVCVLPATGDVAFCVRDGVPPNNNTHANTIALILNNRPFIAGLTIELSGSPPFAGFGGDGGIPDDATYNGPGAVAVDFLGTFYVLDTRNLRVRRLRSFP